MSTSTSAGNISQVESIAVARPPLIFFVRGWIHYGLEYVPGLLVLSPLAGLAWALGQYSQTSYAALSAILLGILVRNLIGLKQFFEAGANL